MSSTSNIMRAVLLSGVVLGIGFAAPSAMAAKAPKVEICHKGEKTIRINENALEAHKDHGDVLGKCDEVASEVLLLTCELTAPDHLVSALSTSVPTDPPAGAFPDYLSGIVVGAGSNCADALQTATAAGCEVKEIFGTSAEQTYSFACPLMSVEIELAP